MTPANPRSPLLHRLDCWNWKCALLSATARSAVYAAAMARGHSGSSLPVVLVEMAYVTLTAGLYAGLQQRALRLRNRTLGALLIVIGVPGLSQVLDWMAHWMAGAVAPQRAAVTVWAFTLLSALFHLYVMRRGAFLTGSGAGSLLQDLRRIPLLTLRFITRPFALGARLLVQMSTAG